MNKNIAGPLLLVAVVLFGGAGVFLSQQGNSLAQNTDVGSQSASVVTAVSKLIALPEGETPTVAEVTDTDALKDQAFFAKAKVGDQVLIYAQAGRAYLFDPKANKILEVAPVTFGETE
ncbi:hypothetical protein K2P56_05205 [Patescibacteria group bacterium]|nr:hypothetical protein [Patescibacteria group bacterium]